MSNSLKKVYLNLLHLTSDPGSPVEGLMYYNTTSHKQRYYDGSAWTDVGGATGANQTLSNLTAPTAINQDLNMTAAFRIFLSANTDIIGLDSTATQKPLIGIDGSDSVVVHGPGGVAINTTTGVMSDAGTGQSVDWYNRILWDGSGSVTSIDWVQRLMINASGVAVVEWNNQELIDAAGNVAIDWNGRSLYDSSGAQVIDFNSGKLYDHLHNTLAMDFGPTRSLYDHTEAVSLNFDTRSLRDTSGQQVLLWNTTALQDHSQNLSIDWAAHKAYDSTGTNSTIDWNNLLLTNSGATAIDWGGRKIYDTTGTNKTGDFNNLLLTNSGQTCINWGARTLNNTSSVPVIDWSTAATLNFTANTLNYFDTSANTIMQMMISGTAINIIAGDSNGSTYHSIVFGSGDSNNTSQSVRVQSGVGGGNHSSGPVSLVSGDGGAGTNTTSGAVTVGTGNSASTNGFSGDTNIVTGDSNAATIVGGSINITTGVNALAGGRGHVKVDAFYLKIPTATTDPTGTFTGGETYYNTSTGKFRGYDGVASAWQDLN